MRKKGFAITSIIFIILLVLLLGALGFFSYKLLFKKDAIMVPDFSQSKQSDVLTWCNSLETNPCTFENDYSDTVDKDGVIYQSIAANEELGDNKINFIISLGKKVEINTPTIKEDTNKQAIENWVKDNNITNKVEYIEEYSETVNRDIVIRIEPNIITNDLDTIKVYISKGKKDDSKTDDEIVVEAGTYIGNTVKDFEEKTKKLSLSPNNNTDRDDYSSTIEKGKIVWHGSGTYEKGETINYGLSLGKNDDAIVVESGTYVGKSLTEFTNLVSKLGKEGLVPKHVESRDDYSSTIEKGKIVWHGSGTYEEKENISYGLSLGKKDSDVTYPVAITSGQYKGKTLDEFKNICKDLGLTPEHSEVHDDEYSDTIAKGCIDWHGSGDYEKGEVIHYTVSLGKKGSSDSDEIVIKSTDYVGKTYNEFKSAVEALGLKPEKSEVHEDAYSSTIVKGSILWHGAGTYVKGEVIHYSLSLGKQGSDTKTVNVVSYAGKTETEFKKYLSDNGLSVGSKTSEYSSTYAAGVIIKNDTGTKNVGSAINYTVSSGKDTRVNVADYTNKSASELENFLSSNGLKGSRSEDYSSTVAQGNIISNSTGQFSAGATVAYKVSLGKKQSVLNKLKDIQSIVGIVNFETAKSNLETYLNNAGFINYTIVGSKSDWKDGVLLSIKVNGNNHDDRAYYDYDVSIVATISTGYSN